MVYFMNNMQIKAINNFFKAVGKLQELKIIRSSKYLGDIGEFLASDKLGLDLVNSQKQKHYDAKKDGKTYQIKFHNAKVGTNINVGNPKNYDFLIIVIGPNSKIKEATHTRTEYRIYKFTKAEVLCWGKRDEKSFYCAKEKLEKTSKKFIIN